MWTPKPYVEYTLLLNVMSVKATHTHNTLAFSLQESAVLKYTEKKFHTVEHHWRKLVSSEIHAGVSVPDVTVLSKHHNNQL